MMIRTPDPLAALDTASDVIDALGGTGAAARLAAPSAPNKHCSVQAVTNWRSTGRLPSYTFLIFSEALSALGKSASPSLWGIAPTREQRSVAQ